MDNIGEILKNKRLEKGLTLEDVSNLTKIRKKYLEALESGNYEDIPEKVYVKGFLKIYSDFLELDRAYILKRYEDINTANNNIIMPNIHVPLNSQELNKNKRNNLLIYIIAAIIGLSLIIWGINRARTTNNPTSLTNSHEITEDIQTENLDNLKPKDFTTDEVPNNELNDNLAIFEETSSIQKPVVHNFDKLIIKIECVVNAWISKTIDGKLVKSYTMLPSMTESIEAQKRVDLRIGNAAGLKINVNGFDLGAIGNQGEVVDLKIILNPNESVQVDIGRQNGSIERKIFKD